MDKYKRKESTELYIRTLNNEEKYNSFLAELEEQWGTPDMVFIGRNPDNRKQVIITFAFKN